MSRTFLIEAGRSITSGVVSWRLRQTESSVSCRFFESLAAQGRSALTRLEAEYALPPFEREALGRLALLLRPSGVKDSRAEEAR
jgi:hypothetical protein